jgi:hypothetical protein
MKRGGARRRPGRPDAPRPGATHVAPSAQSSPPRGAWSRWLARVPWGPAGALAILPLLWASRAPTLGAPVADDYIFLSRLAGERPLDFFGPMGAAYYWRPVSRQLYYLLAGPWLLRVPGLGAALAALMLLALYTVLYRLARRGFAPPLAAALACFPLLSEPARVLIAWPSASQHLLGALFAALAIERAAAGRMALSGIAALLALLSNEAAALVLPALPLVAGLAARSRRVALRWGALAVAVAALWAAGYAVARAHGAGFPHEASGGVSPRGYLAVLVQAAVAQFGYEGLSPAHRPALLAFAGALVAAALALSSGRAARRRIVGAAPALAGGLLWFVLGVLPLVFLLPDWNAWRTTVASLGLACALGGWLALAWPPLAGGLVALRLVALLLARPAPAVATAQPPPSASSFSFARIVRLQRVVESTRDALLGHAPRLRHGGVVRYCNILLLAEVGYAGPLALRTWYGDSTLVWTKFGGVSGWKEPRDVFLEFDPDRPWPATFVEPRAIALYLAALDSAATGDWPAADALALESQRHQPGRELYFHGLLARIRAEAAMRRDDYFHADSLNRLAYELAGETSRYWLMTARMAALRGDRAHAEKALRECLSLDPRDQDGLNLARDLGLLARSP